MSQQSRGCWGGRCWSFSSRPAKLPRVRRKEGGEDGGWCWGQVEGEGGRVPTDSRAFLRTLPTSPAASCSQRGWDKREREREWAGLWPSRGSHELNKRDSKSGCGVHGLYYSAGSRFRVARQQAAAWERWRFAGLDEGYQMPVCTSIGRHWTLVKVPYKHHRRQPRAAVGVKMPYMVPFMADLCHNFALNKPYPSILGLGQLHTVVLGQSMQSKGFDVLCGCGTTASPV